MTSQQERSAGRARHRQVLAVAIGVLALVAAGVLMWRNHARTAASHPQVEELAKVASAAFEAAPMVRLRDREQVRIALASAPVGPPPGFDERELKRAEEAGLSETPDAKQTAALVDLISTWLELQAGADADAYATWMRSRGYRLQLTPDSSRGYEYLSGEPMPEGLTDEMIFRTLFEGPLKSRKGEIRPVALATGPDVLRVQTLQTTEVDGGVFFPTSQQQLFWIGGGVIFTDQVWIPPVQIPELVERDGSVLAAVVLMGCKGATGQWFPLLIYTYLDPNTNEWHIVQTSINNAPRITTAFAF